MQPVGVVHSEVRDRGAMPAFGVPATIEVYEPFTPALHRLEKHTHLWVIGWFGTAERDLLQVTPRGAGNGAAALHGVFSVRSPARPNPLGLTAARILSIQGATIHVDRLDFLDGTPVIDLKPYFASRDMIFAASSAPVGRPASRGALRESLIEQALHFNPERSGGAALAVRVVEHYRTEALSMADLGQCIITTPLQRPKLLDGVMGVARVSPGRGNLRLHSEDSITVEQTDAAWRYELLVTDDAPWSELIDAAEDILFRVRSVW